MLTSLQNEISNMTNMPVSNDYLTLGGCGDNINTALLVYFGMGIA